MKRLIHDRIQDLWMNMENFGPYRFLMGNKEKYPGLVFFSFN